jgi:hypothetical protein
MVYDETDPKTQELAMNGDDVATVVVMSQENPSLYRIIRERCETLVNGAPDVDTVDQSALERYVAAPEWYPHAKRDVGIAMRSLGYYKSSGSWLFGERPKRRKKRRGLYVTKSILKNESRRGIIRIIEMCEADLARRDRIRDGK